MSLQEFAELIAVPRIHRHDHVVQERKCEPIAEEPLHEGEIKADAHAVLMTFAVEGTGREQSTFIEVNVKIELALARRQLRRELALVVFVDLAIVRAEIFLDLVVERVQLIIQDAAVGVVGRFCSNSMRSLPPCSFCIASL